MAAFDRSSLALTSWESQLRRSHGEPLSAPLRAELEARFGCDLSDVRVVISPIAPAPGAAACAVGSTLWFAPGAFEPATRAGRARLEHELTHVLQQRVGRARGEAGRGVTLLCDPDLEAEADYVASGAPVPGSLQAARRPAPSEVAQLQKWGWIDEEIIATNAQTTGAGDNDLWSAAKGKIGWPGNKNPVEFNSTATLNEIRQSRKEAWDRALEIARDLTGKFILVPARVFFVASDADQAISLNRQQEIVDGTRHALVGLSGRVWARYKNGSLPDAAGQGFYYDFGGPVTGGNLLVVEHTQDAQATLKVNTKADGTGSWTQKATVKHFHVAFYGGGYNPYLDTNESGNTATYGGIDIPETTPITQRRSYDIKFIPSHHIYYLT